MDASVKNLAMFANILVLKKFLTSNSIVFPQYTPKDPKIMTFLMGTLCEGLDHQISSELAF